MFSYFEMYLEQEKVVRMDFAERPNPYLLLLGVIVLIGMKYEL